MKCRTIMFLFAICFCCASLVDAKEWRGIVPLKSTRADVERLLGKPNQLGRYEFEDERAYIHYAKGCDQVQYCLCLVPKDTVINIYVTLDGDLKFSDLHLDLKKYKKRRSSHLPNLVSYANDEAGIVYTVDDNLQEVTEISYEPAAADCRKLMKPA